LYKQAKQLLTEKQQEEKGSTKQFSSQTSKKLSEQLHEQQSLLQTNYTTLMNWFGKMFEKENQQAVKSERKSLRRQYSMRSSKKLPLTASLSTTPGSLEFSPPNTPSSLNITSPFLSSPACSQSNTPTPSPTAPSGIALPGSSDDDILSFTEREEVLELEYKKYHKILQAKRWKDEQEFVFFNAKHNTEKIYYENQKGVLERRFETEIEIIRQHGDQVIDLEEHFFGLIHSLFKMKHDLRQSLFNVCYGCWFYGL